MFLELARFSMSLSSFFTSPHTCFCSRLTTRCNTNNGEMNRQSTLRLPPETQDSN